MNRIGSSRAGSDTPGLMSEARLNRIRPDPVLGRAASRRSIEVMPDEQLPELARLAEAGDPDAGARLIHGRRAGELDWERIRLAAYLDSCSPDPRMSRRSPEARP